MISKRYAKALVDSIQHEEEYIEITGQLGQFLELMERDVEFRSGMETVLFSKRQKREILTTIKDKMEFSTKTFNFVMALIEENRLVFLDSILQIVEKFWYEKKGIEKFIVFSAIPLNQAQKERLIKQLEDALQKKVVIENNCEPSLIAGIKIQRGSVFFDFSIAGNLKKLKEELTGVSIPEPFIQIGVDDANKG
ncbi:MAG: ATP synthase F1 subunit delta [Candidatus Aminicenantes bacterium]|nr:ATP synthase F1 subunit delta [Candidatus Aminicenantes bacterium]